jgi:hypothetical protein
MAISGQENIVIGAENQAGGDSLYVAFNKTQNNFTQLFDTASPYNTFNAGLGITATSDSELGTVTITNTGVLNITAGTGIAISASTGNITISSSGTGEIGVTSVNVITDTMDVSGGPIVSAGSIRVDLPMIESITAGSYSAPNITVDDYGRITSIANTTIPSGTVTSVAIDSTGEGLEVSGGPITEDGIITLRNTGVTRIVAGSGIQINDGTGEVTISSLNTNQGTVTSIDVTSTSLTITGSPIITNGTITVDLPEDIIVEGDALVDNLSANVDVQVGNSLTVVSGDSTLGNVATANYFSGNGSLLTSITGANVTGYVPLATSANTATSATSATTAGTVTTAAQPNITSVGTLSSLSVTGNVSANYFIGNGATLTDVTGANVTGYVPLANAANTATSATSATTAGTVTTAAQPNITSVGTLSSLAVTANITAGNANISSNLVVGNTTQGTINTFDLVGSNTITISNTGYLLLNTVTNNNKFVGFQAPTSIAASYIVWQLPNADGSSNSFLSTNGAGSLSFNQPASSSAPLTASSAGVAGQIAFDSTHIYVCIATNSWIRADAAAW